MFSYACYAEKNYWKGTAMNLDIESGQSTRYMQV